MRSFPTPLKIVFAVAAAALPPLVFGVAPAAAKTPCWKTLFLDYSDGRIDKTYPVHCYREAVKHLHEDELVYGSAADDINRALLSAIRKIKSRGHRVDPNTPIQPQSRSKALSRQDGGNDSKHGRGFFGWLADKIGPGSASSIPLPLLVLAGLGLLLTAAAGTSFAARRIQARRAQPAPAGPPTPPRRK